MNPELLNICRVWQECTVIVGDLPSQKATISRLPPPSPPSPAPSPEHRVACVKVHSRALSKEEVATAYEAKTCGGCRVGAAHCGQELDGELRSVPDETAAMSMDLQFEHATDDSKPNRKVCTAAP